MAWGKSGRLLAMVNRDIGPPSSPDLNPMDYGMCRAVERKPCAKPHPNVESLKVSVEKDWDEMSQYSVRMTCATFRSRLEAMLAVKGILRYKLVQGPEIQYSCKNLSWILCFFLLNLGNLENISHWTFFSRTETSVVAF